MILDRMPAEHAADVVDELSSEHAEKILDLMEEDKSEEIQEILEYPEDSAGRLMSQDVVAIRETSTVEDAIQHIRKTVTEERPFGVYAVDDHQHLIGRVPLRRLLLADPRSLILGILEEDVVQRQCDDGPRRGRSGRRQVRPRHRAGRRRSEPAGGHDHRGRRHGRGPGGGVGGHLPHGGLGCRRARAALSAARSPCCACPGCC